MGTTSRNQPRTRARPRFASIAFQAAVNRALVDARHFPLLSEDELNALPRAERKGWSAERFAFVIRAIDQRSQRRSRAEGGAR